VGIFVVRRLLAITLFGIALIPMSCSRSNQSTEPEKHYPMTGEVLSLDAKDQTATIKAGPITGWMEAMTMEFPIRSKSDFDALRVGEKIKATVDVKGGTDYSLSNVQPQSSAK
jgi:protein SCO1/2